MTRTLSANEVLLEVGVQTLRGPDGMPIARNKVYIVVDKSQINPASGTTRADESACQDFAKSMAANFRQYMEGLKRVSA